MNKKALLYLIPSAVIIAGCTPAPSTPGQEPENQAQEAMKIAQILERGGSAFCTITNLSDNSTSEMTISGKKMKIVGNDIAAGKKGTMLNDSVYVYSWEEGQTTGFKMKLPDEEAVTTGQDTEEVPQQVDVEEKATAYDDDTKFKLNCTQRNIADSEFSPPSGINFIDPTQMQNLNPQQLQNMFPQGEEE